MGATVGGVGLSELKAFGELLTVLRGSGVQKV